jgi:DNA-binding cell septation regulator SpoVG
MKRVVKTNLFCVAVLLAACSRNDTSAPPVARGESTAPIPLQHVAAEPSEEEPMAVGGEVTAPVILKRVKPEWPEQVTRQRFWLFSLVVTKTGRVKDLRLVKGESGIYSKLAERAILKWEFRPSLYHGKPVDVRYNLSVTLHAR